MSSLIILLIILSVVIAFFVVCKVRENTERLAEERKENYLVAGEPDPIV